MKSLDMRIRTIVLQAAAAWIWLAGFGSGQSVPPDPAHAQHAPPPAAPSTDQAVDLAHEIAALRAQVAELRAALVQGQASGAAPQQKAMDPTMGRVAPAGPQPAPGGMQGMPGMGGMAGNTRMGGMGSGSGGMGMMDMAMMEMGMGSGPGGMGGAGGMGSGSRGTGMMEMMGMGTMPMGGMGSMAAATTKSALPGFPGASHLYHVGATGFFLDHPDHITLTLEQRTALNQKKEQALLGQGDFARKIEQAEQELWVLTGADQPDAPAIDQKAREIAKLQVDQRIAFIHAVGDAATVLTDEQRRQLTGMLPPQPSPAAAPMPMGDGM